MLDWLLGTKEERQHKAELKNLENEEQRAGGAPMSNLELEQLDSDAHTLAADLSGMPYSDALLDYQELWESRAKGFLARNDAAGLAAFEHLDRHIVSPVIERIEARTRKALEHEAFEALDGCTQRGDDLRDPETAKFLRYAIMEEASERLAGKAKTTLAEHVFDQIIAPRLPAP
jgi:hypothetical protein